MAYHVNCLSPVPWWSSSPTDFWSWCRSWGVKEQYAVFLRKIPAQNRCHFPSFLLQRMCKWRSNNPAHRKLLSAGCFFSCQRLGYPDSLEVLMGPRNFWVHQILVGFSQVWIFASVVFNWKNHMIVTLNSSVTVNPVTGWLILITARNV